MSADLLHVAIILDGNGRWAADRKRPRTDGHREGAHAVRRTIEAAHAQGIGMLTLYAFSSDNWRRPKDEVDTLMGLLRQYLHEESARCAAEGVRVRVIGRRDRLAGDLRDEIDAAESATGAADGLQLNLAVDYSSRDAIRRGEVLRPVDLLIRTGGEQRLSDFLLWECAYAELHFTDVQWPDFGPDDLARAIADFRARDRRYGGLSRPDPAACVASPTE